MKVAVGGIDEQGIGFYRVDIISIFCLPLVFGIALGSNRFLRTSPQSFRRFALLLLMALAILGLLRAAV